MKKFLICLLFIFLLSSNADAFIFGPKGFTILDDADIASDNITSAQARRGVVITNDGKGGAADYNILAGTKGDMVYVVAEEAETITLDLTNVGDVIVLRSGALAAGNAIDSDGNLMSSIWLICHEGTGTGDGVWYVHSQVGVWVDGGAD
jgi:hypothetical protein